MNVTNIGFPFAAPASQGGAADAMAGTGFAGLLAAGSSSGMLTAAGMPSPFGAASPSLPAAAQTGEGLLPATIDSGSVNASLPGNRPQVAMAQLLATAAPVAGTAPVVAGGGNPLADAVAKALAKPVPSEAGTDTVPADLPAPQPTAPEAVPVATPGMEPEVAVEADPTVAASSGTAIPTDQKSVTGKDAKTVPARAVQAPAGGTPQPKVQQGQQDQPDLAVALATPEVQTPLEQPTLPRSASPTRSAAKQDRAVAAAAADLTLPVDAAALGQTGAPMPPLAVPQAPVEAAASDLPAPETPARTSKAATSVSPRSARIDAIVGSDGTIAAGTTEKTGDLARAVAGKAGGGSAEGHAKGEDGQPGFAQQLASAETRPAAVTPLATGAVSAPSTAAPATAAPAKASPAASEPVLNAHPGELGRTLGVEIARKVDAGEDMLRVRLNPAELGRVEVTLAFDDKGNMQATMRAESQHTLDLLRQDAPDLGRALDQAGIRADTSSFRFESRDGGTGSNAGGQSAFQQQQSRGGNQQFQDEPDLPSAAYRPVRSDGQVDLIA
ncbi:flagellar hook-length control protein FliK [Sphingomonas sp. R1]|uniref:flagellar hook-length control protein FliK n=1 Tax=Sphingomonas sp. R1 TaxID=399176 RepID=UPI002224E76E|nr:flagellar hook-length control protein FliK [Sphingomonas sp. R1]UYY78819.1 flagellar hook-length control protein FliK [Sphingomonas sp. R1]